MAIVTLLLLEGPTAQLDVSSMASPQFAASVSLVEAYATVTGPAGELVTDLHREDFTVAEDGTPQTVTTFAAGEFPLTVAILLDRSWSMAGPSLEAAKDAATQFLAALRPDDRALVLSISSHADVIAPLSSDRAAQLAAVARLEAWGTTALHDAVMAALLQLADGQGRRALVLLSDGTDRYSQASAADVLERSRGSDVLIYPIAFARTRPAVFAELAMATGGRSFLARGRFGRVRLSGAQRLAGRQRSSCSAP